jgi:hypothetical protein
MAAEATRSPIRRTWSLARGAKRRASWQLARAFDPIFSGRIVGALSSREQVWCLGDSHIGAFRMVRLPGVWFRVVGVRGATASDLRNPQSQIHAHDVFRDVLRRASHRQHVLVCLGEADCGFLIWHRAEKHEGSVSGLLQETVEQYMNFLMELRDQGFRTVTAMSPPMQTVADYQVAWRDKTAHLRSAITAPMRARTELTLEFNAKVQERCREAGIRFVDISKPQLDPATGLVAKHLVDPRGRDHHMRLGPYAELLQAELRANGFPTP